MGNQNSNAKNTSQAVADEFRTVRRDPYANNAGYSNNAAYGNNTAYGNNATYGDNAYGNNTAYDSDHMTKKEKKAQQEMMKNDPSTAAKDIKNKLDEIKRDVDMIMKNVGTYSKAA